MKQDIPRAYCKFPFFEVLEQAKLIYGDRNCKSGCFWLYKGGDQLWKGTGNLLGYRK